MCMHVYACVCMCMYVLHMYVCVCMCMHAHVYACACACTFMHVCACACVCTRMYVRMHHQQQDEPERALRMRAVPPRCLRTHVHNPVSITGGYSGGNGRGIRCMRAVPPRCLRNTASQCVVNNNHIRHSNHSNHINHVDHVDHIDHIDHVAQNNLT